MLQNNRSNGTRPNLTSGAIVGILVAIISIIIASVISAMLILNEWIPESSIIIAAAIILFGGTLLGSIFGAIKAGGRYAVICAIISGIIIAVSLFSNILFYDSKFETVLISITAVFAGGLSACLIILGKSSKKSLKRKKRSR